VRHLLHPFGVPLIPSRVVRWIKLPVTAVGPAL